MEHEVPPEIQLAQICEELAAPPWDAAELEELVDPKLGIITGFQELLPEQEELRQTGRSGFRRRGSPRVN